MLSKPCSMRLKVGLGRYGAGCSVIAIRPPLFPSLEQDLRANASRYPVGHAVAPYAAFFLALSSLRLINTSAIWIAFSAAPLRKLSDTHHNTSPLSTVASARIRLI